ncbi:DUF2505 domain-containing protein [Kribbella speibonae]|uniref:DUF2505 domain-containing protein n=1 Tax=Kribbella speibonae TaxID=1572660 RepID=A0A4R0IC49_9ACTN|nr:DUF2505 domain-containing protein [Kribbella speibonae]TCC30701.1 DUF2505 domain-containing protein [Kribbella speibonae]
MDLRLSTSYAAAPEEVFAIITDRTFQEQVYERLRVSTYDVSTLDSGEDVVLRLRWETRSGDVSTDVRRFAGEKLVLAQTKIWHPAHDHGAREGDIEGEAVAGRITLTGHTSIIPTGDATTQTFDLHIVASTPAAGPHLEALVTEAIRIRLETKFELAWSWISGSF